MLDKTRRIEILVDKLFPLFSVDEAEKIVTRRAAHLCKADLVTHMVIEMTSLQGIMGRYYALSSGETGPVAEAIYEHYLPRSAEDALPATKPGLVIGIADRLDTLAGLFAVGMAPSGTKDPFAQRRAALTLVQALGKLQVDFDLRRGLALAAEGLPLAASAELLSACFDFIVGRMRSSLLEVEGNRYDVVDAVLAAQGHNPAGVFRAVAQLSRHVARPDWSSILPAFARCVRITRDQKEIFPLNPASLKEPAEKALYAALRSAQAAPRRPGSVDDFLEVFLPMMPAVNRFFDEVLVMAEQPELRANRLGLLQQVVALAEGVADFSRLEGF